MVRYVTILQCVLRYNTTVCAWLQHNILRHVTITHYGVLCYNTTWRVCLQHMLRNNAIWCYTLCLNANQCLCIHIHLHTHIFTQRAVLVTLTAGLCSVHCSVYVSRWCSSCVSLGSVQDGVKELVSFQVDRWRALQGLLRRVS